MKASTLALVLSLALAAGCDQRTAAPPSSKTDTPSASTSASGSTTSSGTTSSANGAPSNAEKSEGSNPQQGQVDPKQPVQQRDFQSKDDGSGPRNRDAEPTAKK